uniref:Mitochondrial import receptor subunit TOM7 homolog n=1 Tax=Lynx canadensis TaxID=61383 RepID=A0A667GFQ4_LYNCA
MLRSQKDTAIALQWHLRGHRVHHLLGFLPLVIYLDFKRNTDPEMPEPIVLSPLWG